MEAKSCGTWTFDSTLGMGDSTKLLRLNALNDSKVGWGTKVGIGWTPLLRVRISGLRTLKQTIVGQWDVTPADPESIAAFAIGDEFSLVPVNATDGPILYEATLVLINPSGTSIGILNADGEAQLYKFVVERFP